MKKILFALMLCNFDYMILLCKIIAPTPLVSDYRAVKILLCKIFLIFIIFIPVVSAQGNVSSNALNQETGISAVNYINIEVSGNGFATVEEEVIVSNTIASIPVPLHVDVLSISDSKNRLRYELLPNDEGQLLTFYLISPMERTVKIKYSTQHLTSKNKGIWTLKFFASVTPYYTIVNVKSPADSGIISIRPDIPRYPANLSNPMWLYPQTNELYLEVDYQTVEGVQSPIPSSNANYEFLILIILIIVLIIALYILLTRKKPKKDEVKEEIKITKKEEDIPLPEEKKEDNAFKEENKRKIKDSVIKMLDENEKKILELLEISEDEITQAYVYKTTGIPKSSLSDIMQRLEKRNIIERRKDGRISWIKLKDWVLG